MSPSRPKLYNPKLVCACALLFTPIFGALLQARNWEEMGIPENARASRVWVRSTVWLIVVYLVLQALFRNEEIANWLGPYFLIVLWGSVGANWPLSTKPMGRTMTVYRSDAR